VPWEENEQEDQGYGDIDEKNEGWLHLNLGCNCVLHRDVQWFEHNEEIF
tara:strand:- start:311 stop:457 length:147 start_codon:yes stop_codon:yes gene_type:complete